jgi:agmatine deiminase
MRRLVVFALILGLSVSTPASMPTELAASVHLASSPDDVPRDWIFPGEYESHEAMWMLWPTYENKAGFPSTTVVSDMVAAMSGHTQVNLAVQDDDDEAAAREFLRGRGVPLDHVHFFHIPHGDLWARDMGPQFVRSRVGNLAVTDWNFNYWGYEEPDSERSLFDEPFDRDAASRVDVRVLDTRPGPTGVRMVHEGGSASHNGHGTMIVVESVVMQRNLGPGRFCGGRAPVTDFRQPNTYAPNPDWKACKALVENEYRRLLGAKKFIWVPTGLIEDTGTFRGAVGSHVQVPRFDGHAIPHAGVYTMFGTNGHPDQFARFVSEDTVVVGETRLSDAPIRTPLDELARWLERENHQRLERIHDIISRATTQSGTPIRVVRIPMPVVTFDHLQPGDGTYDYFVGFDGWEDGSSTPDRMLTVWPASYVNYAPTNDLVLVPRFWRPGLPLEVRRRDNEARDVLKRLFPGREIVQISSDNVIRGGGGMNCITQQQPASARFADACGWAKVKVDVGQTPLYAGPRGSSTLGTVSRLSRRGTDIYLERLSSSQDRVLVRVEGPSRFDGPVGWVDAKSIESAGEKCPSVYSSNAGLSASVGAPAQIPAWRSIVQDVR